VDPIQRCAATGSVLDEGTNCDVADGVCDEGSADVVSLVSQDIGVNDASIVKVEAESRIL
jgi:hypothetical protein